VHNNFYFLRQLSAELNEQISGFTIVSCFSQNKDELVLELNNGVESFFIKANLEQSFCCLSFPNQFHRARKNSVELFEEIHLKKIIQVRQFKNERAFALELENGLALVFKMHGNFANVLLAKGDEVISVFKNQLKNDFVLKLSQLDKQIDFSKESFLKNSDQLPIAYFTLGKVTFDYLREKGFDEMNLEGKWNLFQETIQLLERPNYFVIEKKGKLIFSLFPFGSIVKEFSQPVEAINFFADKLAKDQSFYSEKQKFLSQLNVRLKNAESYLLKGRQKQMELESDHQYQLWGDLVMANLYLLKQGQEKASLKNFYDDSEIEIKLKKELSPQKNAEVFYRKAKNRQIEVDKLNEALKRKEGEKNNLVHLIQVVNEIQDLKMLREAIDRSGLAGKSEEKIKSLPYREFEFHGFKIWVGKNAEANDELTLKYSFKEDLWLHAKDVAGLHVLIKHQAGKNFPKPVIEHAAGLAAFFSKRKTETLCPVAVTPKKFVRKRKGDPAGAVVVEKEEVILVEPILVSRS
jgi:predicted ribosome quality control (RQC) complex YloA/Tae2 family protein